MGTELLMPGCEGWWIVGVVWQYRGDPHAGHRRREQSAGNQSHRGQGEMHIRKDDTNIYNIQSGQILSALCKHI